MSSDRSKSKNNAHFWRACRFLYPYRLMVVVSIVCAIFVSAAVAGGLSTLMPVTRVFLNADTVLTWAEREIAQHRIGVHFGEQTRELRLVRVLPDSPASDAGLSEGDSIARPKTSKPYDSTLDALSDPSLGSVALQVSRAKTL